MIHLIQCLCPKRHAIYAIAYDPEIMSSEDAMAGFKQQISEWVTKKVINPWCGICGSRAWTFEDARTKYKTLKEAKPDLERLELENMLSRQIIELRKVEKN